jgi:hypothetical protein
MTTVLPVHCGQCRAPLELQLIDWDPTVTPAPQVYRCPICQARHPVHLPGKIAFVAKRVVPPVAELK